MEDEIKLVADWTYFKCNTFGQEFGLGEDSDDVLKKCSGLEEPAKDAWKMHAESDDIQRYLNHKSQEPRKDA